MIKSRKYPPKIFPYFIIKFLALILLFSQKKFIVRLKVKEVILPH